MDLIGCSGLLTKDKEATVWS